MSIDMSQFFQVFFEESDEHLAAMETLLLALDIERPDPEQLNAIFRAAHSIKGSSGTFGFTDLTEVTHILENLLDRLRKNEIALRAEMVDAFLDTGDVLKAMLVGHQGGEGAAPEAVRAVCDRLRELSADGAGAAPPAAAGKTPQSAPAATVPAAAGARRYEIEFVPTVQATADATAIGHYLDELRACGELTIVAQPAADERTPGFWHLSLLTGQPAGLLEESLDFIAERDAWRIVENQTVPDDDADGAFGFFDAAPSANWDDDGWGLFELLPESDAEPAPPIPVAEDDDGFGFFEPLPEPTLPEPTPPEPTPSSGDEAYGFFEPLPAPSPAAAVAAPPPVVPLADPVTPPPHRAAKPRAAAPAASETASIRVGVEKVDQLINLVGELVITQAMLLQCASRMQESVPEQLVNGLAQLERNTRDLQESVMSIRMLPISFVFSRFPRVVHDLSSKLGKQVELKMSGEATELDKGLIERITDPLTHLIRNSLDHGVELPETRIAAGKNPCGTITLKAAHQGGNIVIEVGDDGAGLNRQRILAKARERGFQVSEQMSDQEVFQLIFEAGFSTAEVVTDVSGRGVGMDVVRRNIQAMGGRVEIESMTGIGTRMTVRLPLTLAILDGMSIAVSSQTYILPLSYVVESLQPAESDVKTLANQARVIHVRGEYLPVLVLHEIFGIPPTAGSFSRGIMVVLDADGTKVALFVDALVGQHQVVIKSLEQNYRKVQGISGATIMGDGHVALILDVPTLVGMVRKAQLANA